MNLDLRLHHTTPGPLHRGFALCVLILVLLVSTLLPALVFAEEQEGEDLGRHKGLPETRVLTEDAGQKVQAALLALQTPDAANPGGKGVLAGWMADVFGKEGFVRVLGYIELDGALRVFEFRLEDPTEACSGSKTAAWCVRFLTGPPDSWAKGKHANHQVFGKEELQSIWMGSAPPETVQAAVVAGFGSSEVASSESDIYETRSTPGRTGGEEYTGEVADAFRGFESFSRILVLAEVLLALALFFFLVFSKLKTDRWKHVLAWFGLTLVALGARLFLVEHAVFHENHHGFNYIRAILEGQEGTFGLPSSYIIFMHPLVLFTGHTDGILLVWNAVLSALTIPLLGHLVIRLSGSQLAGWAAAIMWAIAPQAIRLAPTASYFNFVAFALIGAALATLFALKEAEDRGWRAWPAVVMAIALVLLSAQARVLTLVFPFGIALLALGAGVLQTRKQRITLGVMGLTVFGVLSHQAMRLYGAFLDHPPTGANLVSPLNNFSRFIDFSTLDPSVVSPTLLLLAFAGGVGLFRGALAKPAIQARALVLGILFFVGVAGSVAGVFISRIRFEIPANAMLTGLAGIGVAALVTWVAKKNKVASMVVGGALVLSACLPYSFLTRPFQDPLEYTFLNEEVLPALQLEMASETVVLVVPKATSPIMVEVGSSWWARKIPQLPAPSSFLEAMKPQGDDVDESVEKPKAYFYLGLDCYWADPQIASDIPPEHISYCPAPFVEGAPRIHPNCARALSGARWKRIVSTTVLKEHTEGSCVSLKPEEESVEIGLFVGEEDPEALALIGAECEPEPLAGTEVSSEETETAETPEKTAPENVNPEEPPAPEDKAETPPPTPPSDINNDGPAAAPVPTEMKESASEEASSPSPEEQDVPGTEKKEEDSPSNP